MVSYHEPLLCLRIGHREPVTGIGNVTDTGSEEHAYFDLTLYIIYDNRKDPDLRELLTGVLSDKLEIFNHICIGPSRGNRTPTSEDIRV